jgi:hypothetical protein
LPDLKTKITKNQSEQDKKKVDEELKKFGKDFENLNFHEEKYKNVKSDQSKGNKVIIVPSGTEEEKKK